MFPVSHCSRHLESNPTTRACQAFAACGHQVRTFFPIEGKDWIRSVSDVQLKVSDLRIGLAPGTSGPHPFDDWFDAEEA